MFEEWMLDETKNKIWQDIKNDLDKMQKSFQRTLDFYTYGG